MDKVIPKPEGGLWGWKNLRAFAQGEPDFLHRLAREYGDIVLFQMGTLNFCLLSNPEDIGEVLVTQAAKFQKAKRDRTVLGRMLGQGLVTSEGDLHKGQRKLIQPIFRKKLIGMYADTMAKHTERLLGRWSEGGRVDLAQEMMELTMFIISEVLFHSDVSEEARKIGEAIAVLQEVANQDFRSPIFWPTWFPIPRNLRGKKASAYLDGVIRKRIEIRKREEAEGKEAADQDLLSLLLREKDEGGKGMSDEQLRDEALTLFVAGHETTSNALAWAFFLLSQNPESRERLHEELDQVLQGKPVTLEDLHNLPYLHKVLKEAMRLYPPAWTLNARSSEEDIVLRGYRIPAGTYLFISPYVMHRDPRFFPAPEVFQPDRFSPEEEEKRHRFAYIPFGGGHRVCIGNAFAMMESALLLGRIAQRFTLDLEADAKVEKRSQITMSPAYGLPMRITVRKPVFAKPGQALQTPASKEAIAEGCPYHTSSGSQAS